MTAHDETHSTSLHLASFSGSAETVQLLIEHGADVATRDGRYRTPLHLASSWVSATIVFSCTADTKDRTIACPTTHMIIGESTMRRPTL